MNNLIYIPEILDDISFIDFNLIPKLSIKDIKLVSYIFDEYEKTKKQNLELNILELQNFMLVKQQEDLFKFFNSIFEKKIIFNISKQDKEYISGEFRLFNSLVKKENIIFISLSAEMIDALDKKGFFYKYHLKNLIKLRNKKTIVFYKKIIIKLFLEKELSISLKNLKAYFEIDDESYTRFFDFEKNIIKPILNELNFIEDFDIFYEKIKSGDNQTNKILGLKFIIQEREIKDKEELLKEIIELIKNDTKNFKKTYQIISQSIDFYGFEYVLKNVKLSKIYPKENFDNFLKEALEKNYAEMNIHDIYNSKHLIFDEEKIFLNITEFQNLIYDYMTSKNLYYSFNINFLNAFKDIKNQNNIWFCDKNYKIIGLFQENDISFVKIFKI